MLYESQKLDLSSTLVFLDESNKWNVIKSSTTKIAYNRKVTVQPNAVQCVRL